MSRKSFLMLHVIFRFCIIYLLFLSIFFKVDVINAQSLKTDSLLKAYKETNDKNRKSILLSSLSELYRKTKPDTALTLARKGLKMAEELNFDQGKLNNIYQLASLYQMMGNEVKALQYLQQGLPLSIKLKDVFLQGRFVYLMGIINQHSYNFKLAEKYLLESLHIFEKTTYYQQTANNLNTIADFYRIHGDIGKAAFYYQKSFQLADQIGDEKTKSYVLFNMAEVFYSVKNYDLAMNYCKQSLVISENGKEYNLLLTTLNRIAEIYLLRNESEKSIEIINRILTFRNSKEAAILDEVGYAYLTLSKCYRKNNPEKAFSIHEIGDALIDSLASIKQTERVAILQSGFELEKKEKEITILENEQNKNKQLTLVLVVSLVLALVLAILFFAISRERKSFNYRLHLKNQELNAQNEEIQSQNEEIQSQSESLHTALNQIRTMNEQLEVKVKERTHSIEKQNKKLREYAFMNSHRLRGPLSSILGLVHIFKIIKKEEIDDELIANLSEASSKLDKVVHKIQEIIRSED